MSEIQLPIAMVRNLHLAQQVDQTSINLITKAIVDIQDDDLYLKKLYAVHDLEYNPKPIKIYIDSYGGEVYSCFGLIGLINSSTTPVHTIVTGCAMSAGFVIAVNGHKRFAYKSSTYMYHQAANHTHGKLKDLEDDIVETRRLQEIMESNVISKTNIPKKKIKEVYDTKTDWYISAQDAVSLGIVDEII